MFSTHEQASRRPSTRNMFVTSGNVMMTPVKMTQLRVRLHAFIPITSCRMTGVTLHCHSGHPTRGCIPRRFCRQPHSAIPYRMQHGNLIDIAVSRLMMPELGGPPESLDFLSSSLLLSSLELSDTKVYEPQIRARLGTTRPHAFGSLCVAARCDAVQGYFAHKKLPTPLGLP